MINIILSVLLIVQLYLIFDIFYVGKICLSDKVELSQKDVVDVVVSLTSTPDRIEYSKRTILSLLNNSVIPKDIIFNVPYVSLKGKEYIIPEWLQEYTKRYPLLKINRCEDYGPATKIIPTLIKYRDNPEQKIIYLDDDQIYSRNYIKNFVSDYKDGVLARRGYFIDKNIDKKCKESSRRIFKYRLVYLILLLLTTFILVGMKWGLTGNLFVLNLLFLGLYIHMKSRKECDVVMGLFGVLVKPKHFNLEKLLGYKDYPKEVVFHDDIYLSGHLRENGVETSAKFDTFPSPVFHKFFFDGLSFSENFDEKNRCVAIKYFDWKK